MRIYLPYAHTHTQVLLSQPLRTHTHTPTPACMHTQGRTSRSHDGRNKEERRQENTSSSSCSAITHLTLRTTNQELCILTKNEDSAEACVRFVGGETTCINAVEGEEGRRESQKKTFWSLLLGWVEVDFLVVAPKLADTLPTILFIDSTCKPIKDLKYSYRQVESRQNSKKG